MSSFATRLDQFIDYLRLSKRAFEEECSISQGNVSHCIKNNTTLSSKNLVKISKRYDELNIDWLINGRGSMLFNLNQNKTIFNKVRGSHKREWKDDRIEYLESQLDKWRCVVHLPNNIAESIVKSHPDTFQHTSDILSELEYIHIIAGTISKGSDAQKTSFYINSSYSAMRKLIDLGFVDSGTAFGEVLLKKAEWNHSYHICADIAKYLVRHYYRFEDLETAEQYDELFYKYTEMYMVEYEAQKLYCKVIYNHKHGLSVDKKSIQESLDHIRSKMQFDSCNYHYFYYQCLCILSDGEEYLEHCKEAVEYFTNLYFNHEAYIAIFLNKMVYYQIENDQLETAKVNLKRLFEIVKYGSSKWFIAMYSKVNLLLKQGKEEEAFDNYQVVINHSNYIERTNDEKMEWDALLLHIENVKQKVSSSKNKKT